MKKFPFDGATTPLPDMPKLFLPTWYEARRMGAAQAESVKSLRLRLGWDAETITKVMRSQGEPITEAHAGIVIHGLTQLNSLKRHDPFGEPPTVEEFIAWLGRQVEGAKALASRPAVLDALIAARDLRGWKPADIRRMCGIWGKKYPGDLSAQAVNILLDEVQDERNRTPQEAEAAIKRRLG